MEIILLDSSVVNPWCSLAKSKDEKELEIENRKKQDFRIKKGNEGEGIAPSFWLSVGFY